MNHTIQTSRRPKARKVCLILLAWAAASFIAAQMIRWGLSLWLAMELL